VAEINTTGTSPNDAYEAGRRAGLATAALALSIAAFINLLSLEKSVLAIVLGFLALKGARHRRAEHRFARAAIVIGAVHVVTLVTVLIVFHDRLAELIRLLRQIG
jgi:hypothetical protein